MLKRARKWMEKYEPGLRMLLNGDKYIANTGALFALESRANKFIEYDRAL